MSIQLEWDEHNIKKIKTQHGLNRQLIESVFEDVQALYYPDVLHSLDESRNIVVGTCQNGAVLQVVFTVRKEHIRVITAFPSYGRFIKAYQQKA